MRIANLYDITIWAIRSAENSICILLPSPSPHSNLYRGLTTDPSFLNSDVTRSSAFVTTCVTFCVTFLARLAEHIITVISTFTFTNRAYYPTLHNWGTLLCHEELLYSCHPFPFVILIILSFLGSVGLS
jgi:hypothetical protein